MNEVVVVEKRGAAQWLIINREERRNAINEQVMTRLTDAVGAAAADSDLRAIVLTGAGNKAFCAGGDLQPGADGTPFTINWANPRHFVVEFLRAVEACPLPLVARVNGHVMAGGLGLLCACDLAVASDTARFGTPESKVGLFPMMILPHMLRILPRRKLMELCITGEAFSAVEALDMGLVNYVAPPGELDAKLDWFLGRITDKSPTAIRLGKQACHAMEDMNLMSSLEYAQLMLPVMAQTEDAREGMRAFAEKRPPVWTGR
jgi:enoyl-CoA hydratase/carnithine racemase